jgi:SAM-dependent methyltransferase
MNSENFCPVCNFFNVESFFTRKNVPANQNFLIPEKNSALKVVTGNLELQICNNCSFIYNQQFHLDKVEYGNSYENSQDESPLFEEHLSKLAKNLIIEKNIKNSTIVEVGCGKGSFLKKLINFDDRKNIGVGFDPSFTGDGLENKNLKFVKFFYDSDSADIKADVVVCRHVIEHIPNPVDFLKTVRTALSSSKNPRIFFETPDVDWILKNHVLWDFFYEHCSYFNPKSIRTAFELAGFKIESIEHVFNNQYMLIQASLSDDIISTFGTTNETIKLAKDFSIQEQKHYNFWKNKIDTLFLNGKIAIWGAGAKGVTFLNLFDLNSKLIDCVVDINPKKQGMFIPGTGHKIIPPHEIEAKNITNIIIMNPNYFEEIQSNLKQLNLKINLII